LTGRYHLRYRISERIASFSASLSTFRPLELDEELRRTDYEGSFDVKSLLHHITHSSLPSVMDIGHGFARDVLFSRNAKPILLLLFDSEIHHQLPKLFAQMAKELYPSYTLAQIDRSNSVKLTTFMEEIRLSGDDFPALCEMTKESIHCSTHITDLDAEKIKSLSKSTHEVKVDHRKAHPLKHIQIEQINEIFGAQEVMALPDPMHVDESVDIIDPHDFENMESAVMSGCPMMAHLNNVRDEL